jgi:5,5'-dehydrodivanillate O-demethylase
VKENVRLVNNETTNAMRLIRAVHPALGSLHLGRVCLWPNGFFLGDHFEWRVPIDDEHTLSIAWIFDRLPNEHEPFV